MASYIPHVTPNAGVCRRCLLSVWYKNGKAPQPRARGWDEQRAGFGLTLSRFYEGSYKRRESLGRGNGERAHSLDGIKCGGVQVCRNAQPRDSSVFFWEFWFFHLRCGHGVQWLTKHSPQQAADTLSAPKEQCIFNSMTTF